MAYGPYTLTGEGLQVFGPFAGILVTDVDIQVTAYPPNSRVVGASEPLGLWHVGMVAVGWSPEGVFGLDPEIVEQHFIVSKRQDWFLYNKRIDVFLDTLFWKLLPGVEIVVNVYNL